MTMMAGNRPVDFSVLPADLAALYSGSELDHAVIQLDDGQLALPVDSAEDEFRRWLEAQPQSDYLAAPR